MSLELEDELRASLARNADVIDASAVTDRLTAYEYQPRSRRRPSLPVLGVAAGALVAGITTAAILLASGAPAAYAGWTAVPHAAPAAAVTAAVSACDRVEEDFQGGLKPPVLTDARGRYTAAVFVIGTTVYVCISDGIRNDSSVSSGNAVIGWYSKPRPDQLGLPGGGGGSAPGFPGSTNPNQPVPLWIRAAERNAKEKFKNNPTILARRLAGLRRFLTYGHEQNLEGLAGRNVISVTFIFKGGTTVEATVEHGWYFAWWPMWADPTKVSVTTNSGTVISSMATAKCLAKQTRCVFAAVRPPSKRKLSKHPPD